MIPSICASDLDGTFLDRRGIMHPLNEKAVRCAAARSIPFVFATGRPLRWLTPLDPILDTHPWAIAVNGAITYDMAAKTILAIRRLPDPVVCDVMAEVRRVLPTALFACEYTRSWSAEPGYPQRHDEDAQLYDEAQRLVTGEPIVKLLILDKYTPTDQLAQIVTPVVGDRLEVTYSYVAPVGQLELSAPGVNKASSLSELMHDLGVDPDRLVAFGDMPNDLAMLKLAGRGYVMAGAHLSMLASGFPVAGDHDDAGVGRTILDLLSPGTEPSGSGQASI